MKSMRYNSTYCLIRQVVATPYPLKLFSVRLWALEEYTKQINAGYGAVTSVKGFNNILNLDFSESFDTVHFGELGIVALYS